MLMQRQGSDVTFAYKFGETDPKDREATQICGDGLVEKIPYSDALTKYFSKRDTLWVFDTNEWAGLAQRLINAKRLVIGTSALSAQMEHDRMFAAKLAKNVGLDLPETREFESYSEAISFLESRKSQAFVYKPNEGDPTGTFVPQEIDEPSKANTELREYIGSLKPEGKPSFVLQALIPDGVEANFDIWLRRGKPIAAFLDLESKRKLTGDLGMNVGCAGDYVTKVPVESKGVEQTVGRYVGLQNLASYTGSVDANVVFSRGKILFLENCFRFGYNAFPALFYALAKRPAEQIFREWITGEKALDGAFDSGFAGSLTLMCDKCEKGRPILISRSAEEHVCVYQAFKDNGHLAEVGGW